MKDDSTETYQAPAPT